MIEILGALLLVSALVSASPAPGAELHVPGDYGSIQAAIDAATDGDRIRIAGGRYDEAVVIDDSTGIVIKKIAIENADPDGDGTSADSSDHVWLRKSRVGPVGRAGVSFYNSTFSLIEGVHFEQNGDAGVWVDYSAKVRIRDNVFRSCSRMGVRAFYSSYVRVKANRFADVPHSMPIPAGSTETESRRVASKSGCGASGMRSPETAS